MHGSRLAVSEELGSEVEKILASETFRNSEALRRLLRFLADKTLAGEAEMLKEYTIGLDVIGKPASYDPRSDSSVRIQVGRLRQKLAQYYLQEAKSNKWIVDLPKGQFGLTCEPAAKAPEAQPAPEGPASANIDVVPRKAAVLVRALAASFVVLACLVSFLVYSLWTERKTNRELETTWSPELNELWRMFLDPRRPSLVTVLDRPMAAIQGFGVYTDLRYNDWESLVNSDKVRDLSKLYGDKAVRRLYLTPRHDLDIYFQLGKQLGPRVPSLSLVNTRDVSWQQMSDNNMIFIGSQEFYETLLRGLPVDLDFSFDQQGFRNLKPQGTEPALFVDRPPKEIEENGESMAIISNLPGPRGLGVVRTFGATRGGARLGAVEAFMEPQYAKSLVQKLRMPSGKIPQFFQLVLKVKYKNGLPTDIEYVTHHELRARQKFLEYKQ